MAPCEKKCLSLFRWGSDDTEMDGVSESMEGSSAHADEDSTDQSLAVAYAFKGIYQLYDFDAPNAGVFLFPPFPNCSRAQRGFLCVCVCV